MTAWLWARDHILPGLATSGVSGLFIWLSHRRTKQHVERVTDQQNRHIDELTAQQTKTLTTDRGDGRP